MQFCMGLLRNAEGNCRFARGLLRIAEDIAVLHEGFSEMQRVIASFARGLLRIAEGNLRTSQNCRG